MPDFGGLSADQINASMGFGPGGVGAQNQFLLNNLYGPGGFGAQTDAYSQLGAEYGRNTGGFGGTPLSANNPELMREYNQRAGGSVFDTGAAPYNDYGNPNLGAGMQPNIGGTPGFQGGDPPATFDQRFGNLPGQPYGPGYFDNTFGSVAGENPQTTAPKVSPSQISSPPIDWDKYFNDATAPAGGSGWEAGYLLANPDVAAAAKAAGGNPNTFADQHWQQHGQAEGRTFFDPVKYLQQNADVAASGMNPFEHFNKFGRAEGRGEPTANVFDPRTYLAQNADVGASGMDPTAHWLQFGQKENRSGGGVVPTMPTIPGAMPDPNKLLGYDPNSRMTAAQTSQPAPNGSRDAIAAALLYQNSGTPNMYTASPYTNTQGQTFQPNLPPGFQTQFGPDDPNGALNAAEQQRLLSQTPRS